MNDKKYKLDKEEQDLLESVESGEWRSVKNIKATQSKAKVMAQNTLKKDQRINIRMPSSDLDRLKQLAAYEGLPYQTLISSILHKYAAGHLRG